MQQPDFEFQLSKSIRLRGVGWRGLLAFAILVAGTSIGGHMAARFAQASAQVVATTFGWP